MHDWNDTGNGMNGWHGEGAEHSFGAWHWVGMSIGLAILIAAIVAVVLIVRRLTAQSPSPLAAGSPEATLRDRFARGEIDAEEFRSRMQVLSEPHGS